MGLYDATGWDLTLTAAKPGANAGALATYLKGLGYAAGTRSGELAASVGADGTVRLNATVPAGRDAAADVAAYAVPAPAPPPDVWAALALALDPGASAADKQAMLARIAAWRAARGGG